MVALNPTPMTPTDRYIPAGTRRYINVPTIADPGGVPTASEINGGTDVTAEITEDGVEGFNTEADDVVVGDYGSRTRGKIPGMIELSDSSIKTYASRTSTDARQLWTDDLQTNIVVLPEGTAGTKMNVFKVRVKNNNTLNDAAGEAAAIMTQFSIQKVKKNVTIPST